MKETKAIKAIRITGSTPVEVRKALRNRKTEEFTHEEEINMPFDIKRLIDYIKKYPEKSNLDIALQFGIFENQVSFLKHHMSTREKEVKTVGKIENSETA
jgi:hypothetical protein